MRRHSFGCEADGADDLRTNAQAHHRDGSFISRPSGAKMRAAVAHPVSLALQISVERPPTQRPIRASETANFFGAIGPKLDLPSNARSRPGF
jgi:hypothetical protein